MKYCPNCGTRITIPRHLKWRIRVRLYTTDSAEPLADTDPEVSASAPGTALLQSLPDVADHVTRLVRGYHVVDDSDITGLEPETLRRRLRGLRPTISRRRGTAVWRLPYTVYDIMFHGEYCPRDYVARVDVERVRS